MAAILSRPQCVNSLAHEKCGNNFASVFLKLMLIYISSTSSEAGLMWVLQIPVKINPHCFRKWFGVIKMSFQYRKSHCGDKTVVISSYFDHGIPYSGKITSAPRFGSRWFIAQLVDQHLKNGFSWLFKFKFKILYLLIQVHLSSCPSVPRSLRN